MHPGEALLPHQLIWPASIEPRNGAGDPGGVWLGSSSRITRLTDFSSPGGWLHGLVARNGHRFAPGQPALALVSAIAPRPHPPTRPPPPAAHHMVKAPPRSRSRPPQGPLTMLTVLQASPRPDGLR